MHKVLLVEDSKEIYNMVDRALASSVELVWAQNLQEGREKLGHGVSLVLLDVELPDGNGIELCNDIQQNMPETPVFFLTSHTDLSDKVMGFTAGADDYITKPFQALELKVRVETKLKKMELQKQLSDVYRWSEIEVDKTKQEVLLKAGEEQRVLDLTALEFKILVYFCTHVGAVVPRDQMLDDIWGKDVHIYARSVDTHVSKLRKKLSEASHIIESVHGTGYRFIPTDITDLS